MINSGRAARGIGAILSATSLVVGLTGVAAPAGAATSRTWHTEAPAPSTKPDGDLTDVSCPTSAFCAAVGSAEVTGFGSSLGYSEIKRNGTWRIVPLGLPPGTQFTSAAAVSCSSATWCVSVGTEHPIGTSDTQPFVQKYDGTRWSKLAFAPLVGASSTNSTLTDVSCVSRTFCMATGNTADNAQSFAEAWDGTSWRQTYLSTPFTPSPDADEPGRNVLNSVSCRSTTFCLAVGGYLSTGGEDTNTVVQQWNGTTWSERPAAEIAFGNIVVTAYPEALVSLAQVACPTSVDCTAVGNLRNDGISRTYVEVTLHGATVHKTSQEVPDSRDGPSHLSCDAPTSCYATLSDRRDRPGRSATSTMLPGRPSSPSSPAWSAGRSTARSPVTAGSPRCTPACSTTTARSRTASTSPLRHRPRGTG